MDDADLAAWLARAREGDEAAFRERLKRFEGEVRVAVRHRLPRFMRSQYDSIDFVQADWQSVFTGRRLDLSRFENPRHLRGYLSGVARNKGTEEHRRRTTLKYDIGREEPLYVRGGNCEVSREVLGNDPSTSQDAQAGDRLDQILRGRSPLEWQVIDLRRLEPTYQEIAERLRIHESAVRRIVESIPQCLEDLPCR